MIDKIVLSLAKSAIISHFDKNYTIDKDNLLKTHPFLSDKGASFVTLELNHSLRGCIGSIVAHRELFDDIIYNALSATLHDPRFKPLSAEEFNNLSLEVSLLSEPKPLEYSDYNDLLTKLTPQLDGVILKYGSNQSTFLPQVWEQLPEVEEFLTHLAHKAGITPQTLHNNPEIYTYRVESIKERFDAISQL